MEDRQKVYGIVFHVGGQYFNRLGTYTVKSMDKINMVVVMDGSKEERKLKISHAARVYSNIKLEERKCLMGIQDMDSQANFAWTLGVICAIGRLEVEVGYFYWDIFSKRYVGATGLDPTGLPRCYRLDVNTDKPGHETRVYFPKWLINEDYFTFPKGVKWVDSTNNSEKRVNNNEMWWNLIRLGFRLVEKQNAAEIARNLGDRSERFWDGYKYNEMIK